MEIQTNILFELELKKTLISWSKTLNNQVGQKKNCRITIISVLARYFKVYEYNSVYFLNHHSYPYSYTHILTRESVKPHFHLHLIMM